MLFYDFEVFQYDWLVVIIDMEAQTEHVIVNDSNELECFYNKHRDDIWVGFNSRRYDQFILKSILCGLNPKECNDHIISKGQSGYSFTPLLNKISLNNYDVMQGNDRGLKAFEGFLGSMIKESSIPFDLDRKLTKEEIEETIKYCRHDVLQTIEVFMQRQSDFKAQMDLLKMFNLPLSYINKTKVQLSAEILGAEKHEWNDEFDVHLPKCAIVKKYTQVPKWFLNPQNHHYNDGKKSHQLKVMIAGVPTVFGWGGVHSAKENYHSKGYFLNMDVGSLYPTLDILFPDYCFSRSVPPEGLERYKWILNHRLELKHQGKKKEQAPLKIVLNGTYGAMKDKYNKLYDPRGANNTCVFGQILVGVDLVERLEETGVCEIIQVNTDGVLIKLKKYEDYDLIDDVAHEWEQRTGLTLEFDDYGFGEVYQKDVNNYVIIDEWGHYKSKGAYVKSLSNLDYDLPIVNKALIDYMVHKTPIEKTINDCNDLKEFQMVRKISSKYSHLLYGGYKEKIKKVNQLTGRLKTDVVFAGDMVKLNEKCVRVFASKDNNDGGVWKVKEKDKVERLAGTPEHSFIFNDDVNGVKITKKLDKEWYIKTAYERLSGFGVYI